jgi:nicotinate-nucleotide adenylyltransferase
MQQCGSRQYLCLNKLCLGGSFNPIHHAHLICARAAAEAVGASAVTLVPTAVPPHKQGIEMASAEHRLAMCQAGIKGAQGFETDDREIRRGGPSYTIDTVRQMKAQGSARVGWIIGSDMLNYLPKWRDAGALLDEVEFVVMARPGVAFDWTSLPADFQKLKEHIVTVPQVEISSTDIRQRLAKSLPIDFLTPPAVCRYIAEHELYRSRSGNLENR